MADNSRIEWTDSTWNPTRGCSLVSAGCTNCYAMRVAHRFSGDEQPYAGLTKMTSHGPVWTGAVTIRPEMLLQPMHWRKPQRIFVDSMSDLFHEEVPDDFILSVFTVMARCPQHTFQVLTKRPERMEYLLTTWGNQGLTLREGRGVVLPNVWLGVSVEDQATADERIPLLLQTPAAVRWISAEPLLGPIDLLSTGKGDILYECECGGAGCDLCEGIPRLDWVVVGGESGPNARPMHPDWARSLRDQCQAAGVPYFFKQWGQWYPIGLVADFQTLEDIPPGSVYFPGAGGYIFQHRSKKAAGRELDGRTWDEYPT